MDVLHFILGPVVGCVIGAFTNFIALKMLFRPLKPVKIGKFTLPFTPGIIPKHQEALADSLSDIVYKNFFSNNDIEDIFMSDEMADVFSDGIYDSLGLGSPGKSLVALEKIKDTLGEEKSSEIKLNMQAAIYNRVHGAIQNTNITSLVSSEAQKTIKEKTKGMLLADKLLSDSRVETISDYIGFGVDRYIKDHDVDIIAPLLSEMTSKTTLTQSDISADLGIDKDTIKVLIKGGYMDFMKSSKEKIADTFHIKQFMHDKIMELNPADIERLVNAAIKREMNYLVYLGGLLGLVIGLINSFF